MAIEGILGLNERMSPLTRSLLLVAAVALAAGSSIATAGETQADGWEALSNWRFNQGLAAFRQDDRGEGESRALSQLGRATALINSQPRMPAKLVEAERLLTATVETFPQSEEARASLYLLARIENDYKRPTDFTKAASLYRKLIDANPLDFFGQLAVSKYGFARLYGRLDDSERQRRFAELETLGQPLTMPAALRNFHYMMGDAALRFGYSPGVAREHYRRAVEAGIPFRRNLADAYIRIAELSADMGDNAQARAFYQRYLDEFPIETRRKLIQDKLAALPRVRE